MTIEQPEALLMAEVLKADGWPSVAAKLPMLYWMLTNQRSSEMQKTAIQMVERLES